MSIKSSICDLAAHFPPSSRLARAADRKATTPSATSACYYDGAIVFPDGGSVSAHWRMRTVRKRRRACDRDVFATTCDVLGFARMKDALPVRVNRPVFLETMLGGKPTIKPAPALFNNTFASMTFIDEQQQSCFPISNGEGSYFLKVRPDEVTPNLDDLSPPALLAPYATILLEGDYLHKLAKSRLPTDDELTFSLLDNQVFLHGRYWPSSLSRASIFGRHWRKSVVNASPTLETLFREAPKPDLALPTRATLKQRRAELQGLESETSIERVRRASLSSRERAIEDLETLRNQLRHYPYAGTSHYKIRSLSQHDEQFYVPSPANSDWFPSQVLCDVLNTHGLTTVHLRPRLIEVVKETPFAIYQYFICGTGVWDWYRRHQPSRYFQGQFEGLRDGGSVG